MDIILWAPLAGIGAALCFVAGYLASHWVKDWSLIGARNERDEFARRLNLIAAQETPGANATAKRMARIARGEAV